MKIKEITSILERIAPPNLQESYDNSGLLVGNNNDEVDKVLICLDATEEIVDEAIATKSNLIIAHHPIVFGGLKRLNGTNYVERVVIKAIQNKIAIYAIHTNLDNVLNQGVNAKISQKLGLLDTKILKRKKGELRKLVTFVPEKYADAVRSALFTAGAGTIGNYSECSFNLVGSGTFTGNQDTNAFVGKKGEQHQESEVRIETVVPPQLCTQVERALLEAHPYEEVAFDWYVLDNSWNEVGAGMIGELEVPLSKTEFLAHVKQKLKVDVIRFTSPKNIERIKTVAVCGGAGSFLIDNAKGSKADAYVTGDVKYHEFFDAEDDLFLCDVGHYESEQFTIELIGEILLEKIPNFAVIFTRAITNPIKYYY
ncbi:MAG: dinuclear metal center YbgI/SA1388 family protein [Bacteroidia bacterium]|jgi:dinuclear metal center YbgI/SA1388 family protein